MKTGWMPHDDEQAAKEAEVSIHLTSLRSVGFFLFLRSGFAAACSMKPVFVTELGLH
jgi:hypothetical protein